MLVSRIYPHLLLSFFLLFAQLSFSQENQTTSPDSMNTHFPMLGLRTTIYQVGDIQAAKVWYTKAFGTEPYFDEPFYVGFNIGGYELGLQPEENPTTDKTESVASYWGVEDIQAVYVHLLEIGATEHEAPQNVGGELMTATVKDPFGNVLGLIYNPYFQLKE